MNRHLNNEGQKWKIGHTKGKALIRKEGQKKEVNKVIGVMYFLYKNEYIIFKPVELTIKED
jgi:hypothetical protein